MENESIVYWIQFHTVDDKWQDSSGHHSLAEAKDRRAWAEKNTPNKYRIVKRVTTVLENDND